MDPLKLLIGANRQVTEAQQQFTFSRRAFFLGGTQVGIGVLLAGRMAWLAVAENEKYALLAESNRVNLQIIPPRRGWIVDRNGRPIALNRTAFRVDLIPDRLADKDAVLTELAQVMRLTPVDVERVRADLKKRLGSSPCQWPKILIGKRSPQSAFGPPKCRALPPASSSPVTTQKAQAWAI